MCSTTRAGKTSRRTSVSRPLRNTERSWVLGRSCSKHSAGRFSGRVRVMTSRALSGLILRLKRCAGACSSSSFYMVWEKHSERCCRRRKRAEHGGRHNRTPQNIGGAKTKRPRILRGLESKLFDPYSGCRKLLLFLGGGLLLTFFSCVLHRLILPDIKILRLQNRNVIHI